MVGSGQIPPVQTAPRQVSWSADLGRVHQARSKFQDILSELLNHVANADSVEIHLDVKAVKADGFDPQVVRILEENGKQLGAKPYWD